MRKFKLIVSLTIWMAALPLAKAADDDLVVIVNKSNAIDNISKAQLRRLLLGEQDSWPGGKKVSVILRAPGQPERSGVLRTICGMTEDDFTQHLMHASFSGDSTGAPKALGTGTAVRQLVATLPGGIGFVHAAEVSDSVKVLTVDGAAAGHPGYKVKAGK